MVLAPEHPLVGKLVTPEKRALVEAYIEQTLRQTDIQREAADKEKTGVFTGGYAINPVNRHRIPVWIADYVLMTYGTGAIMAVPAHDERDFAFALKFGLPILPVIDRSDGKAKSCAVAGSMKSGFTQALSAAGIHFTPQADGSLQIELLNEKIDKYLQIAQAYLQPGFWNEVVGAQWKFIFPDGVRSWNSVESEREILDLCKALEPKVSQIRTVMEMLWSCEFYRDVLYHDQIGTMIHSGEFSGTKGEIAISVVTSALEQRGIGRKAINYRLRDWLISRQRYWGAPIPIIYCPEHGAVDVPEEQLPVLLPDDVEWKPTGESPLKLHPTWKLTTCPICGQPAERETDTMDTFMCSSWYHLRYLSPWYDRGPFDPAEYNYWMPVDTYTGGIEHATMHLIYTRFFHKAIRDCGILNGLEPMLQLRNQGMVLGEDSEKMSKSRGNVIAPDNLVDRYGADTVRAYLMFFARWDMGAPWNSSGIEGSARWIRRVWAFFTEDEPQKVPIHGDVERQLRRKLHQSLRRITHDFERFEFNTIVSTLMELLNEMYKARESGAVGTPTWEQAKDYYLRMMAPVAPHLAEELWSILGKPYSIHTQTWPVFDEEAAREDEITLVVQVNGKLRDRIVVSAGIDDASARQAALSSPAVQRLLEGKTPQKVVVVPGKLVNIVL
jgi:leucyl-tRNA synthetase